MNKSLVRRLARIETEVIEAQIDAGLAQMSDADIEALASLPIGQPALLTSAQHAAVLRLEELAGLKIDLSR